MTVTLDRPAAGLPDPPPPDWRRRLQPLVAARGGWTTALLLTLVAGLLRFVRLALPATTLDAKGHLAGPGKIFDEIYYACDAQNLLRFGVEHEVLKPSETCVPTGGGSFIVHPPLGKWLIALGEQAFGVNTLGWRFSAALFGTLTVLLVVRIGRRMTGSTLLGGLAGLLLALDGLHFVSSRVGLLDVFLCFWLVAAFGALVLDRDQLRGRLAAEMPPGARPWRWVAGAGLGAACATKWSGLFPAAVMVLLTLSWEIGARRAAGDRTPRRSTARRTTLPLLAAFVALPLAVYLASWAGWFASDVGWDRHWAQGRGTSWWLLPGSLRSLWHYHAEILQFHTGLDARHPYQSHPLSWPFLGRPVSYYYPPGITAGTYGCRVASCSREVLAIGTPALWWASVPVAVLLVARWVARRDWRAGALVSLMVVNIAAWEPSDLHARTMFLFYALPSVPFLCLGAALVVGWGLGRAGTRRRSVVAFAGGVWTSLVVLNFVYLYPVLAAVTIPYGQWLARMWFRSWI